MNNKHDTESLFKVPLHPQVAQAHYESREQHYPT